MKNNLRKRILSSLFSVGFVAAMGLNATGFASGYMDTPYGYIEYGVYSIDYNHYGPAIVTNQIGIGKYTANDGVLTMNSGSVYNVCAGGTEKASASNNKIRVNGGTVNGSAAGGFTFGSGLLSGNSIYITGGTIGSSGNQYDYQGAYGGLSYGGSSVKDNKAVIEANSKNVYAYLITGGATVKKGAATNNSVSVDGSGTTIKWGAAGGSTVDGAAKDNSATMYAGTVGNLVGGYVEGKGAVTGNKALLSGGIVKEIAAGGASIGKGTVSKNTLTITGGSVEGDGDYSYSDNYVGAYGGLSQGGGKADYNVATMTGGEAYLVCGGATVLKGSATGNKVTISGDSWVDWGVAGGATIDGACKNNIVDINGGDIGNVVGAYVGDDGDDSAPIYGKGSASGNVVNITNGTIRYNAGAARTINGSASKNVINISGGEVEWDTFGALVEGNGSATSNKVVVTGGRVHEVYGASTFNKGAATSNSVVISGQSTQAGNIFGAYSEAGAASKNTITIEDGTVMFVTGAHTTTGAASSNAVYINGGNISHDVAGGITEGGKLTSNKVEIKGGRITAENIYGAKGEDVTSASGNSVKIIGTAQVNVSDGIYGALLDNIDEGDYNDWGYLDTSSLIKASVSSNVVNISNVNAEVVYGAQIVGNGSASKNSVTINNGEYGIVSGALVCNEGDVSSNKVNITGEVECLSVYGGTTDVGAASKNSITLNGNIKISGNIIGGDTFEGRAENNTIIAKGNINAAEAYVCGGSALGRRATSNAVTLIEGMYGTVVGGYSSSAECMSNKVTITNAEVFNGVTGGYGESNKISGNKVTITGSKLAGTIYGGHNGNNYTGWLKNTVVSNKVSITNSEGIGTIYGGYHMADRDTSSNNVTIKNLTYTGSIYGGYSENGNVLKNSVSVSDSYIKGNIYGGYTENDRSATSNTVTVKNSQVYGSVYGGYSKDGSTLKNSVTISNSYIEGDVVGGNKEDGKCGNKITLSGNTTVKGAIWGYQSGKGIPEDKKAQNEEHRNNVLQLNNYSGSVSSLHDIDSIVATNVNWQDGGTLLTVRSAVDDGMDVNVESISGYSRVRVGDSMTLLATEGTENVVEAEQTSTTARVGYGLNAELNILDNVATVRAINVSEAAKGIGESRTAATAFVNQGSDLIEDSLNNLDSTTDGVNTFASMQGNASRYETGSHIKVNGKSGIVGISKSVNEGKITYGAFFENGSGNYNTHFEGNRGDGKAVYNGGGLLLNTKLDKGVYVEASMRAGKLKNDLKKALAGGEGYHTETTYYGAHLGIGKLIDISDTTQLDVYGKYIYTHNSDESFMIGGQKYEFDDLDSSRVKAGLRINRKVNDKLSLYYGTAYEYEIDGKATNKVAGYDMNNPELKGGTILGEVGVTCKASSKWSLDLNVKGYAGQRDGFTTNVQAVYAF